MFASEAFTDFMTQIQKSRMLIMVLFTKMRIYNNCATVSLQRPFKRIYLVHISQALLVVIYVFIERRGKSLERGFEGGIVCN